MDERDDQPFRELDDQQLLEKLITSVEDYSHILVQKYQTRIFIYIKNRWFQQPQDAEDITQEVFFKACKSLEHKDGESNAARRERLRRYTLRPWLFAIARNTCVNELRRRNCQRRGGNQPPPISLENPDEQAMLDTMATTSEHPIEDALQIKEDWACTYKWLMQMEDKERKAILLHYVEGLGVKEVVSLLPTTKEKNVKKWLKLWKERRHSLRDAEDE